MPINNESHKKINFMAILIIAIGGLFYCYEFLLRIIPGALEAELSEAYGNVTAGTFGQISAFYYFAYSPMQLPVGMLMDRYGPRRLLTFACLSCTIGSFFYTYTDNIYLAACGRFLVGFGSSFAFVGVLSLTTNWLPRRLFSFVVGLITTMGMLGLVYGEIKISHWSTTLGWEYVLYLMIFLGAGLTVLISLLVRDGPKGHKPDVQPWPRFFYQVYKVVASHEVWIIGIVGACLYTSLSVFGEMWGKTYLIQAHQLTNIQAAKTVSSVFFGWAVGAPLAGFFSDNSGRRVMPLAMGAIVACICISMVLYVPGLSYMALNILLFTYGLSSAVEIIVFIMAKENTGAELSGTVFAVTNLIVTIGGVIFQPLVGKILDVLEEQHYTLPIHQYSVADFQIALSVLPISMLLVTILAFFLKDARTSKL